MLFLELKSGRRKERKTKEAQRSKVRDLLDLDVDLPSQLESQWEPRENCMGQACGVPGTVEAMLHPGGHTTVEAADLGSAPCRDLGAGTESRVEGM